MIYVKKDLINIFKCPDCNSELELIEIFDQKGSIIINGKIECKNKHKFEINNRVLILFKG